MQDATLLFTLLDADGIRTRQPIRLALVAVPDALPQVAVSTPGIGSAITPNARIPVEGTITDDYGVAKVWVEYVVDKGSGKLKPARLPLVPLSTHPTELKLTDAASDVEKWEVKPGQKVVMTVKAEDLCTFPKPNIGSGEEKQFDIVSPEQLRAILEGRELVLRQRFEAIRNEVVATRDRLLQTKFSESEGQSSRAKLLLADQTMRMGKVPPTAA